MLPVTLRFMLRQELVRCDVVVRGDHELLRLVPRLHRHHEIHQPRLEPGHDKNGPARLP